jgi:hypothetical protein
MSAQPCAVATEITWAPALSLIDDGCYRPYKIDRSAVPPLASPPVLGLGCPSCPALPSTGVKYRSRASDRGWPHLALTDKRILRCDWQVAPGRACSFELREGRESRNRQRRIVFSLPGHPLHVPKVNKLRRPRTNSQRTSSVSASPSSSNHGPYYLARTLVKNGAVDCVLVIGFEQMQPGSIKSMRNDRPSPMGLSMRMMADTRGVNKSSPNAQYFANAGKEYMEKYGAEARDSAEIARISHEHSQRDPYAQFRDVYSLEQIEQAPMIHWPLKKLQCSLRSDKAGAAVIVSQRFLDARPHLKEQAILMAGQSLLTDSPQLHSKSSMDLVAYDMTRRAAKAALDEARVRPKTTKSASCTIVFRRMSSYGPEWGHHLWRHRPHCQSVRWTHQQRPSSGSDWTRTMR